MKLIGSILLVVGSIIFLWNGYSWWEQRQGVINVSASSTDHTLLIESSSHPKGGDNKSKKVNQELQKGSRIASLTIPQLDNLYPVYWGTDSGTLKKGVGMYDSQWTVPPNVTGHTVLSGHRDTIFTELGELQQGDLLYLDYDKVRYIYDIVDIWITDKNDRTVIVSKNEPILTLTTCYPFNFLGSAPKRYIIQAKLVDN